MFGVDVVNPWSSEQTLTGHSDQIKGVVPAFRSAFFFFFFLFFFLFLISTEMVYLGAAGLCYKAGVT